MDALCLSPFDWGYNEGSTYEVIWILFSHAFTEQICQDPGGI